MGEKEKGRWVYIVVGMLTTAVTLAFARMSYGVVLPYMRAGLDMSFKEAGYLGTIVSLGYLGTVVFAGILASRWGSRRTILIGISCVTAGFLGLSLTRSFKVSAMFMLILGVGTAFTYTPLISLMAAKFVENRGFVIGLVSGGVGLGMLFTGFMVPYLNFRLPESGWRLAWSIYAMFGILVLFLTLRFIQNPSVHQPAKGGGRALRWDIYSNRNVILVGVIYAIVGMTYIIQAVFNMSFMLSAGLSAQFAGHLIAGNGVLSVLTGPAWGFLSDHLGRKFSLNLTMAVNALATLLPVLHPRVWSFTLSMLVLSLVVSGIFAMVQATSMDQVKPGDMPIAFSYVTLYFAVGQFIGPTVAGWLIEDWGGFRTAFLFSALTLVTAFVLTLRLKTGVSVKGSDLSKRQAEAEGVSSLHGLDL